MNTEAGLQLSMLEQSTIERAAAKQRVSAYHSNLNWRIETRELILSELCSHAWSSAFRTVIIEREPTAIQLDLHSDRIFPKPGNPESKEREKPARITAVIHPNGSIWFRVSGFQSSHTTFPSNRYPVALYTHANELAGSYGRSRIRRHIREFEKLAYLSLTEVLPTRDTVKFIADIESRANRFLPLYESPSEARRAEVKQNAAIAGGLAVGLVSSTVFPTLLELGKNARRAAEEIHAKCQAASYIERCLETSSYEAQRFAGNWITPDTMLVAALVVTGFALSALKRYIRR